MPGDRRVTRRTILVDGEVAGNLAFHTLFGEPEVGYWLGESYWGRGMATRALALFLVEVVTVRPLYAYTAKDNPGSQRVLEKRGFVIGGEQKEFSEIRGEAVEEYTLMIAGSARPEVSPEPHPER